MFTYANFFRFMASALLDALVIFGINLLVLNENFVLSADGYAIDYWSFSFHQFTSIIVLAEFQIALLTYYWTSINVIFITLFSFCIYLIYCPVYR